MTAFDFGPVAYNGVSFQTGLKVKCRMETVYSRSGRHVKYVRYVLEVDGILTADSCSLNYSSMGEWNSNWNSNDYPSVTPGRTEGHMMDIRQNLLVEGGDLWAANIGLGFDIAIRPWSDTSSASEQGVPPKTHNVVIYQNSPIRWRTDVMFGPKPRILDWEPIGGAKACRVHWVCEFHLPTCIDVPQETGNDIAQMESTIVWSIAEAGIVTRTITSIVEVASNFVDMGGGVVLAGTGRRGGVNDANHYREKLFDKFPHLEGFTRNSQFALSADQRTLLATIVDRELDTGGNAYYPGVIDADVAYSTKNVNEIAMNYWQSSLSGTISVRAGLSKRVAYAAMMVILAEKLEHFFAENEIEADENTAWEPVIEYYTGKTKTTEKGRNFVLVGFAITEQIFGRGIAFSVSWRFPSAFKALIKTAGHFEPLDSVKKLRGLKGEEWERPHHHWPSWMQDMTARAQTPYGYRHLSENDVLPRDMVVGFCEREDEDTGDVARKEEFDDVKSSPILGNNKPAPEASWMGFRNNLDVYEDTHTATQVVLEEPKEIVGPDTKETIQGNFAKSESGHTAIVARKSGPSIDNIEVPSGSNDPDQTVVQEPLVGNKVIFRRTSSTFKVRMRGVAMRAGRASPIPHMFEVNGTPCPLVTRATEVIPISRAGCPIFMTKWDLVFEVDGEPGGDLSEVSYYGHPLTEGLV